MTSIGDLRFLKWIPPVLIAATTLIGLEIIRKVGLEPREMSADPNSLSQLPWLLSPQSRPSQLVAQTETRLAWEISVAIVTVLFGCSIGVGFWVPRSVLPNSTWKWWRNISVLGLIAAVLIVLYLSLSKSLFSNAAAEEILVRGGSAAMRRIIDLSDFLFFFIAPLFLAFAATSVLYSRELKEDAEFNYSQQLEGLKLILIVGAAMLVSGMLEVSAFYSMGQPLLDITDKGTYSGMAKSFSAICGVYFSFTLILIYVPASYILQCSISQQQRASWRQEKTLGWQEPIVRIIAIFSPILAGLPLGDWFQTLIKNH
jgi:hypothetical protein